MAKRLKPYGAGYEKPEKRHKKHVYHDNLASSLASSYAYQSRMLSEMEIIMRAGLVEGRATEQPTPPPPKEPGFIEPGDTVICMRDGGRDPDGMPKDVPLAGHRYVVHSFYLAPYGMGVVLNNVDGTPLDNYPYRGYKFAEPSFSQYGKPQLVVFFKKDDEDGTT